MTSILICLWRGRQRWYWSTKWHNWYLDVLVVRATEGVENAWHFLQPVVWHLHCCKLVLEPSQRLFNTAVMILLQNIKNAPEMPCSACGETFLENHWTSDRKCVMLMHPRRRERPDKPRTCSTSRQACPACGGRWPRWLGSCPCTTEQATALWKRGGAPWKLNIVKNLFGQGGM